MISNNVYREFKNDQEAYDWSTHYFGQWIKDIQVNRDNIDMNSIGGLLYTYTGSMNILYNQYLRA